jgi:hypothetical protein
MGGQVSLVIYLRASEWIVRMSNVYGCLVGN